MLKDIPPDKRRTVNWEFGQIPHDDKATCSGGCVARVSCDVANKGLHLGDWVSYSRPEALAPQIAAIKTVFPAIGVREIPGLKRFASPVFPLHASLRKFDRSFR